MSTTDVTPSDRSNSLARTLARALNLRRGLDHPEQIDADIREGVSVLGSNLWVLMFAILIASVGLNVNSAAVIIGAMLISPLMGPIIGIGYALAIRDFDLLRVASRNLAVFTGISLATSTIYFTLSPLQLPGSELLARTSPTLWDVLIAFFGGSAGIIALTRHNISTVVPGVAIATALMPPLCTAGFALSQGRWDWFMGAIYLFAINGVFIAYATLLFVKLMRLRTPADVERSSLARARGLTALTLIVVMVPSVYLGWRLVAAQGYQQAVRAGVERVSLESGVVVLSSSIDAEQRQVELTVAGEDRPADLALRLREHLKARGMPDTRVVVRSASGRPLDVGGIKRDIENEVVGVLSRQTEELRAELKQLQESRVQAQQPATDLKLLAQEIAAQHPAIGAIWATESAADEGRQAVLALLGDWHRLSKKDMERIRSWLAVRLAGREVVFAQVLPSR